MTHLPLAMRTNMARYTTGTGPAVLVPVVRVICTLAVGPGRHLLDGWVDTASPLTVFPQRAWERFADEVAWIGEPTARFTAAVGGGSYPFRFGQVSVAVFSADLRTSLPPVVVSAMFTFDDNRIRNTLVGLWGGVLAGRRLVVEPDLASARLEAA